MIKIYFLLLKNKKNLHTFEKLAETFHRDTAAAADADDVIIMMIMTSS